MSNKTKIFLFSSVLLNVLLLGLIIGHISNHIIRNNVKHPLTGITSNLPFEKEELLKITMKKLHKQNLANRAMIIEKRVEIVDVLGAPEFDEEAFNERVEELHNLHGAMAMSLAEVTKNLALQFNQDERKVLAEILKQHPHRSHNRRHPGSEHYPRRGKPPLQH